MAWRINISRWLPGIIPVLLFVLPFLPLHCRSNPSPVEILFDPRSNNFPFPSDLIHTAFFNADFPDATTSPLRPRLSESQKASFNAVLPGLDSALAGRKGFSPGGPILVKFSGWIDTDSLPPTPESSAGEESPVILLNYDRGQGHLGKRYPFRWKFDWDDNILVIEPRDPLERGEMHLLVITDKLKDTGGSPVRSSSFLRLMKADYILENEYLEKIRRNYATIFSDLRDLLGLSPENVRLALEFTTSASIPDPLADLINDTRLRALPVPGNIRFSPSPAGNLSFRGELLLPDYLDWKGHLIKMNPDTGRYPQLLPGFRADFTLTFPAPGTVILPGGFTIPVSPPFPLVILQPGWSGTGSSLAGLPDVLARSGTASLVIDSVFPDPDRAYPSDSSASALPFWRKLPGWDLEAQSFDPAGFRDFILQSSAALSLVFQDLPRISSLDLYPRSFTSAGDGIPDLDLTRLGFFGELFGATAGILALSRQTEIQIGGFRRTGCDWAETFFNNPSWSSILAAGLEQRGFSSSDIYLLKSLLGTLWDPSDPLYFPPSYLSEETGGAGLHHLLMQSIVPDFLVPGSASLALGRAYGIPLLLPFLTAEPGMETEECPAGKNILDSYSGGIFEFPDSDLLTGEDEGSRPDRQAASFFSSFFYSGEAVIINPESQ